MTNYITSGNQYGKTYRARCSVTGYRFIRFWVFVAVSKAAVNGGSASDLYEPTLNVIRAAESRGFL